MRLFALEHDEKDHRADVALYSVAAAALTGYLLWFGHPARLSEIVALVMLGLAGWTLMEYVLHRFVLHGLNPFHQWHAEHHKRPTALIFTPTIASATLIATFVFLPALLEWNLPLACALTLGVVVGYLVYTLTHHATHHWPAHTPWLKRRKRWHALHHHHVDDPICFGVTTSLWDHVFGTANRARSVRING